MVAQAESPQDWQGSEQPFDLTPTEEQQMVVDSLRRFAAEVMRPHAAKADWDKSLPAEFLQQAAQLGLPLLNIPESCGGGGGRSAVSGVLAAEALAHGDMAMAIAALAPFSFVNALVDQGTEEQSQQWLSALLSEDFVAATLAIAEPGVGGGDALKPMTVAKRDGTDWVLDGIKLATPLGVSAQLILVTAMDSEAGAPAAFIVERGAAGLEVQSEPWMGLCALDLSEVRLSGVRVAAAARLGTADSVPDIARLVALGRIGTAALATGVCQAVVDYCVPYCNERVAFGEPISHRQAVAFKLADAATETDGMRLLVWRAASLADAPAEMRAGAPDMVRAASLAYDLAARRGMEIGSDGVQLLGGHGYTREHPVELWYRNLRSVAVLEAATLV